MIGIRPQDSAGQARTAADPHEERVERLLDRLPERMRAIARRLRRPAARPARVAAGVLLIAGAFLSILPVFGVWMAPLGLILLAEDIPPLRRLRNRTLEWAERRRPRWFGGGATGPGDSAGRR